MTAGPLGRSGGGRPDDVLEGDEGLRKRYWIGRAGKAITAAALGLAALFLAFLLYDIFQRGGGAIDWHFLTSNVNPSSPEASGIFNALVGSVLTMGVTMGFSVPVGVAAALYLEELAEDTWIRQGLQRLIENLAGVPSIVFGLLGLALFVEDFGFGASVLSGGLTLGLLVLPIVIVSAQEAIASVPDSFRNGARALGATDWQVVRDQVLPNALPGIMTGTILALSRAIGETAPILFMASVFISGGGLPSGLLDGFLALPTQIFHWAVLPDPAWHELASGAIIVLLALLLVLNATAVAVRQWSLSRRNW